MKKYIVVIVVVAVVIAGALYFYSRSADRPAVATQSTQIAPATGGGAVAPAAFAGEVLETMNAGGYTYVRIKGAGAGEDIWAAGPETPVKVGETVSVPAGMKMEKFRSDTLDRDFDAVYFVTEIRTGSAPAPGGMPPGHPQVNAGGDVPEGIDLSGIEVPDGGRTIAAVFADKGSLGGKEVVVRGIVVKFTPGVMGKNWIHMRDGTGAEGTNDLTVTTNATAAVGDLVTVSGKVTLDKDFGFSYAYDVLIEDAKVTVE